MEEQIRIIVQSWRRRDYHRRSGGRGGAPPNIQRVLFPSREQSAMDRHGFVVRNWGQGGGVVTCMGHP